MSMTMQNPYYEFIAVEKANCELPFELWGAEDKAWYLQTLQDEQQEKERQLAEKVLPWERVYKLTAGQTLEQQNIYSIQRSGITYMGNSLNAHSSVLGVNPKAVPQQIKVLNEATNTYIHLELWDTSGMFGENVVVYRKQLADDKPIYLNLWLDNLEYTQPQPPTDVLPLQGRTLASFTELEQVLGQPHKKETGLIWFLRFCDGMVTITSPAAEDKEQPQPWDIGGDSPLAYYRTQTILKGQTARPF